MTYLFVFVVVVVLGGASQWYVSHSLSKYQKVPSASGWSGLQTAQAMMDHTGIGRLKVHRGQAHQNHFNLKSNSITLDPHAYGQSSVTAVATACHEVGHACQYAEGNAMMKFRESFYPVMRFVQQVWLLLVIAGMFFQISGLAWCGVAFYACAVLFNLVTLPMEFDASRRGLAYMKETGALQGDVEGAEKVLRACALTYVAAALISVIHLVYQLQRATRRK